MTICGDCLIELSECAHAGEYPRERASAAHAHKYIYGDIPGIGECRCGAYRVWDRESQTYKEINNEPTVNDLVKEIAENAQL